jgi:hypothetical protein
MLQKTKKIPHPATLGYLESLPLSLSLSRERCLWFHYSCPPSLTKNLLEVVGANLYFLGFSKAENSNILQNGTSQTAFSKQQRERESIKERGIDREATRVRSSGRDAPRASEVGACETTTPILFYRAITTLIRYTLPHSENLITAHECSFLFTQTKKKDSDFGNYFYPTVKTRYQYISIFKKLAKFRQISKLLKKNRK